MADQKIVYKLESPYYTTPKRGYVIKETEKLYIVKFDLADRITFNWRKSECLSDIQSASKAYVEFAQKRLEWAKEEVVRRERDIVKALEWEKVERDLLSQSPHSPETD